MSVDAIDPTWINALQVDAEELRRDMGFLLAAGATPDVSRTGVLDPRALTVTLSGDNLQVNPGGCAVGTGKGAYLTGAAATATIATLGSTEWPAADATNPRRDRVVLEILDPDNGGGAGRKAQFRVVAGMPSATAASGGGYPAPPSSPSITLFDVDVPKAGSGNPTLTDRRPFTAAAGAPIPVRSLAERDALTKFDGLSVRRMDLPGRPVETVESSTWRSPTIAPTFYTFLDPQPSFGFSGTCAVTPLSDGKKRVEVDLAVVRDGAGVLNLTGADIPQSLGVVLPTAARGTSNTKAIATYLNGGGSGPIPVQVNVVPSSGEIEVRSQSAQSWIQGATASVNLTYYI